MSTPRKHTLSHWHYGTPDEDVVLVRNTGRNPVSSCILNAPDIRQDHTGYVTKADLARHPQLVAMSDAPANVGQTTTITASAATVEIPEAPPTVESPAFDPGTYSAKEAKDLIAAAGSAEELLPWAHDPRATVRKALEDRMAELGG